VLLKRMQAFQANLEQVVAEKDEALRARLLG
jgi:5-(carboxyamino)imidazole ribonucleotide mutase